MTTVYEIPLIAAPQTFGVQLDGVQYNFTLVYRDAIGGGWFLDIADANQNPLVGGIVLVTGTNLLAPYRYLGFTGQLWVQSDADPTAVPTFDNLGQTPGGHLYYVSAT